MDLVIKMYSASKDFFLRDWDGMPFTGVTIKDVNSGHSLLVQSSKVVGHVFIQAPEGATGHKLTTSGQEILHMMISKEKK